MNTEALISSPFALMLAPEEVFRALKESQLLNPRQGRICRPLDDVDRAKPPVQPAVKAEGPTDFGL